MGVAKYLKVSIRPPLPIYETITLKRHRNLLSFFNCQALVPSPVTLHCPPYHRLCLQTRDTSLNCPELNLIKDKIPVLGLVERRSSLFLSNLLEITCLGRSKHFSEYLILVSQVSVSKISTLLLQGYPGKNRLKPLNFVHQKWLKLVQIKKSKKNHKKSSCLKVLLRKLHK